MTAYSQQDLLLQLDQTRERHEQLLVQVNPSIVVHSDTGWTVRDILAHVAMWEAQGVFSIGSSLDQQQYLLKNFVDTNTFNEERHQEMLPLKAIEVLVLWKEVRKELKSLIEQMTDEQLNTPYQISEPFVSLGGERTPAEMIVGLIEHEQEHIKEIQHKTNSDKYR